jgi:hypothetical protein
VRFLIERIPMFSCDGRVSSIQAFVGGKECGKEHTTITRSGIKWLICAIKLLRGRRGSNLGAEFNQTFWAASQLLPSSFGSIPNCP